MVTRRPPSLAKLLDRYSPAMIQRAFILQWATANDVPETAIRGAARLEKLLFDAPQEPIPSALTHTLQAHFPQCSLKQVEQVFEELIGQQKRQSHGTVYTPEYIIDYLLTNALHFGWQNSSRPPKICDPACGAGGVLLRAADFLHQHYQLSFEQIFNECLVGVDVDPWAIETAHIMIDLYLLLKGVRPDAVQVNLVHADTLLTLLPALLAQTRAPAGFDVIVTNPPYVKLQNLEMGYRDALLREYGSFVQGNFSLSLLFLVRCYALLSAQGSAALITQNNLFTSLAGRGVREYLQQERCVRQIVDFGHHKVFANASAYTCLIFLGRVPSSEFAYGVLTNTNRVDVNAQVLAALPLSHVKLDGLDARKWRLAKPNHLDNLRRIETTGIPLGQLAAIRVGFATLKDAVFLVTDSGGEVGDDCLATDGDDVYAIERTITKPVRRLSDIANNDALSTSAYRVIFPYQKVNGRYVLIPEEELAHNYPHAYGYLVAHRDALFERDKRRKHYAGWYAWGRTQGMEAIGPKLLTKTFSKRPHFALDSTDYLYCNGYGLFRKARTAAASVMPLDALARILNSRIMHYYAKLTSFQLAGDYQCYQKNFIERFGIPQLSSDEIVSMMALPVGEVDDYLAGVYGVTQAELDEVVGDGTG